MAASGQSKGSSSPPSGGKTAPAKGKSKGKPAGTRKPAAGHAKGEPSVKVPMSWVAVGADIGKPFSLHGLRFPWPQVTNTLARIDAPPTDNVVIVPRPTELAEGVCDIYPRSKIVKGKLPDLVLHDEWHHDPTPWYDYQEEHPPRSAHLSEADWSRTLTLPKE